MEMMIAYKKKPSRIKKEYEEQTV